MILVHSSVQDLHLIQVCDTTTIYIFRGVSFTSTNYRSRWYWYTAQSRIYSCYWCVKQQQYIFSEESASPPPTIGPNDTGTQLSLGFTFATGVWNNNNIYFQTNYRSEWYWYTAQSRIYICYRCVTQQQYIFSEESASPPPTIGPDDTGTQLSPGFTLATGVWHNNNIYFQRSQLHLHQL